MKKISIALVAASLLVLGTKSFAAPPARSIAVEGVLIKTVVPNSPAAQVGLKSGDRILSIAGMPTEDVFDMAWAISSHAPGTRLELQVVRDGKAIALEGTLGRAVRTTPVSVRPIVTVRPTRVPVYNFTPGEINDQRAFGG